MISIEIAHIQKELLNINCLNRNNFIKMNGVHKRLMIYNIQSLRFKKLDAFLPFKFHNITLM